MLELVNICKQAGGQSILKNVSLEIKKGEFFSLLGPSGCGKTTLLRLISGLDQPSSGDILFKGQSLFGLTAQERPFNMVFQKHALFPHLSVSENIAFGLKMKKISSAEIKNRTQEMIEIVGLEGFEDRLPETLSGGQSQRVALARALVNKPEVLLLDEPLSALDLKMRERMQIELTQLQKSLGLTFISITHDQDEAMTMSDRIAVMNNGRIEQVSRPQDLYHQPQSVFTARFVGHSSILKGTLLSNADGVARVQVAMQDETILQGVLAQNDLESSTGASVEVHIRPEAFEITTTPTLLADCDQSLPARVIRQVFRGAMTEVYLEVQPEQILMTSIDEREAQKLRLCEGQNVFLQFSCSDVKIFREL